MTKPRQFKKGEVYHIIKRGVGSQEIFKDKQDYSRCSLELEFCNNQGPIDLWETITGTNKGASEAPLAERVEEARNEKGESLTDLLGFALMPTHMHLIVREIMNNGISRYMQKLAGYSIYFNDRHDRGGSLFRRYRSVPIETDEQLQIVFAYVHTNPISLWEPGWKEFEVEDKEKAIKKLE